MTTKEQIIAWAREAGFSPKHTDVYFDRQLERFATLVRNAALEDAAQVTSNWPVRNWKQDDCAQAIRNLKETT